MFSFRVCTAAAVVALSTGVIAAPATSSERVILAGCVISVPPAETVAPRHLVWSEDGAMLAAASVRIGGREIDPAPTLYWLDDQEDLKDYAGRRVELSGTLEEEFEQGELTLDVEDGFVEITATVGNEEATARIPRSIFKHHDVVDLRLQVLVRKVDVETVTAVSGEPCRE